MIEWDESIDDNDKMFMMKLIMSINDRTAEIVEHPTDTIRVVRGWEETQDDPRPHFLIRYPQGDDMSDRDIHIHKIRTYSSYHQVWYFDPLPT